MTPLPIPQPPPIQVRSVGEILLLQQVQQNAALLEQCKSLTSLLEVKEKQLASLAAGSRGGLPADPDWDDPQREKLRGMTLEQYAFEHYLPGTNHTTASAVAEITQDLFGKINACFAEKPLLRDVRDSWVETFRNWLLSRVGAGFSKATANKYLRQLRSIYNYAAKKKLLHSLSSIDFLDETPREVEPLTPDQLAALENQAGMQTGMIGRVASAVFWTAWLLVFEKLGSRVTATMLCRRSDYDFATRSILFRAETQKQGKDQRIALPPRAAAAVERLLAAHDHERIFGCWPHDPPLKSGRRKWRTLARHFRERIAKPAGVTLPKWVVIHVFRHTAATMCEDNGGNAQELLGHSSPKTTKIYTRKSRRRICKQSLCIPDADPQRLLFQTDRSKAPPSGV
jgi:integrase